MATIVRGDVLDSGVPDVADDEDSGRGGGRDSAEIMSESEDGPAVGDSTERGVCGVRELAVVDELSTDDSVLAGLPGRALSLRRGSSVSRAPLNHWQRDVH